MVKKIKSKINRRLTKAHFVEDDLLAQKNEEYRIQSEKDNEKNNQGIKKLKS